MSCDKSTIIFFRSVCGSLWRSPKNAIGILSVALISTAVLVVAFATGGCGGSPSSPSDASLAGSWAGTYRDQICGNGTIENTRITQNGSSLTGRFALRLFEPPCTNLPGWTTSGSVNGTSVMLTGRPDWTMPETRYPVCSIELVGVKVSDNRITGTHRWTNCSLTSDGRMVEISGTFEMQRQ